MAGGQREKWLSWMGQPRWLVLTRSIRRVAVFLLVKWKWAAVQRNCIAIYDRQWSLIPRHEAETVFLHKNIRYLGLGTVGIPTPSLPPYLSLGEILPARYVRAKRT